MGERESLKYGARDKKIDRERERERERKRGSLKYGERVRESV